MSINAHLHELRRKHATLSERVEKAQRSPGIDDLHVSQLKKEKLQLKQEIHRLSGAQPG
jgi:hypothetical protein